MQTAFSMSTEEVLVHLLGQIAVIPAAAECVGAAFVRIGQSRSVDHGPDPDGARPDADPGRRG